MAEWLTATLYIAISNIHRRRALQKKPLNYGSKEGMVKSTIFSIWHLVLCFIEVHVDFEHGCPCSLKYLWKFRAEIQAGLSPADDPRQKPGQLSLAVWIQAPASTHTHHILLRAACFTKNTIPWKRELWLKIAQRSRSSLKMTPSLFNLHFPWSWESCKAALQVCLWGEIVVQAQCAKAHCWGSVVTRRDSLFSANIWQFSFFVA